MRGFIVTHGIRIAKDFIPETFGRLTTLGPKFLLPVGEKGECKAFQVCQCICCPDRFLLVATANLRNGNTKSCGCAQKEAVRRTIDGNTIHGMSHSSEYFAWRGMRTRCSSAANANYGGRGVRVFPAWDTTKGGFASFFSYLGRKPSKSHSLDRIDVNGDYEPGNVRWATLKEQQRNKRNNRMVTHGGKTQCIAAWAEEVGLSKSVIRTRLEHGWPIDKALYSSVAKTKVR